MLPAVTSVVGATAAVSAVARTAATRAAGAATLVAATTSSGAVIGGSVRAYATEDGGELKKTALHASHVALGAKMVPFCGWEMPVEYKAGTKDAHLQTRASAGLFDVSHMQQIRFHGDDRVEFIERLVPGEIKKLKAGNARLSVYTNDQGGIQDDTIITRNKDHLYVVCNAGCADKDIAHFEAKMAEHSDLDVTMELIHDDALLALQGPHAAAVVERLCESDIDFTYWNFMSGKVATLAGLPCYVTRCGYTGEDGFEISVPNANAVELMETLLAQPEVEPIGLGARDSLRLEAGLCLYGNDIEEDTTPVEAGLSWVIGKRRREEGGFPGADIILGQLKNGADRHLTGMVLGKGPPARQHYPIVDADGNVISEVTSGGPSPSTGQNVAMAYLPTALAAKGSKVNIQVRRRVVEATVTGLPFTPGKYYRAPKKAKK